MRGGDDERGKVIADLSGSLRERSIIKPCTVMAYSRSSTHLPWNIRGSKDGLSFRQSVNGTKAPSGITRTPLGRSVCLDPLIPHHFC